MKRIGLALGGGGARGIAHIAVIEALEEMWTKSVGGIRHVGGRDGGRHVRGRP